MCPLRTIGVIGAGAMGSGISEIAAIAGVNVILIDINDAALAKGLETIGGNLARQVAKSKITDAEEGDCSGIDPRNHDVRGA